MEIGKFKDKIVIIRAPQHCNVQVVQRLIVKIREADVVYVREALAFNDQIMQNELQNEGGGSAGLCGPLWRAGQDIL